MKAIKILMLLFVFTCLYRTGTSQISIAPQISSMLFFDEFQELNFGLGFKGDYRQSSKVVYYGSVNAYLPQKHRGETYASANGYMTTPQKIYLETSEKSNLVHAYLGGKYHFIGDHEDNFNVYVFGEFGLMLFKESQEIITDYDEQNYLVYGVYDGESKFSGIINIGGGLGLEKKLNFGFLFLDTKLIVPVKNIYGFDDISERALSTSVNVGVRFSLDY